MKKIINPWKGIKGYFCFGCSPDNEAGLKMEFYEEGNEVISMWHPEARYQGWLNTLHGGIQAVLLDEICAWTVVRKLQTTGVTSKMETRYLKPVKTTDDFITLKASVRERSTSGMSHIPEDRHKYGLVLDYTLADEGVGLPAENPNLTEEDLAAVVEAEEAIIGGSVTVSTVPQTSADNPLIIG